MWPTRVQLLVFRRQLVSGPVLALVYELVAPSRLAHLSDAAQSKVSALPRLSDGLAAPLGAVVGAIPTIFPSAQTRSSLLANLFYCPADSRSHRPVAYYKPV